MGENSGIAWTDNTFNPWIGCTKVSPGCDHCYAEGTFVGADRTRVEIEEQLRRFGADAFSSGYDGKTAFIMFRARGRFIRLTLPLPDPNEQRFKLTDTGRARSTGSTQDAYEAEYRRLWRSLALLVKAKLAAITDGIVEFEEEFLAHVVLPNGQRIGDYSKPAIAHAYETGETPRLLPGPGGAL